MKIEDMTFEQLNACFSLLVQIIENLSAFGNDGMNTWKYVIEIERHVGTTMNKRIDEMLSEVEGRH